MTTTTQRAPAAPATTRRKVAHIEAAPGRALCGARLGSTPVTAASARCIVCEALAASTRWSQR